MELNIMIERADIDDAREILDLQKLAYQSEAEIYNDYTIPPLTQTVEEIRDDFEKQVFLKASMDGRIIGSVRAYLKEETCFVGRLIVHPDFQKQGIGTRLMHEIKRYYSKTSRFELFTGNKSERNISFYQKLGYQVFKAETVTKDLQLLYMEKFL
jgi:ribosomal protein S18 acetylase RimI-like enzyme